MEQLFLRTEAGRELTWEELDTNWMRIKNGVDALEVQLQDTRQQRDWVLPLYFYGNESSEHYIRLAYREFEDYPSGVLEEVHPDYTIYNTQAGLFGFSDNYEYTASYSVYDIDLSYGISVQRFSPFSAMGINVLANEVNIDSHLGRAWRTLSMGSELQLGFFGELAPQQSIAETSSDAAITEIQNILIAFGLATDNRS
jgi:hypothetical protein